jgi:hypothetical protein
VSGRWISSVPYPAAASREGLLPLLADTEAQLAGFTQLVATAIANTG